VAFHDVRFPASIEQGAVGGPVFSTAISETTGGNEYRQANWTLPRFKWDVATGLQSEADYLALYGFFMARLGRLHSWRFRDWSDYQAPIGSPVVAVPGAANTYRLAKAYPSGPVTFLRPITKPVAGSVTLSAGAVDYSTGIVSGGASVTWSGDFDVCCRFDSDEWKLTLEQIAVGQATGIAIIEVRE